MSKTHRRTFIVQCIAASSAVVTSSVMAQTSGAKLEETDPQAVALGYRRDTAKVDTAKYPKHTAAQSCASCQLYQGKPTEPFGGCPLFAGKQVASAGWCSAWVKKP